jgi:chemotaxis protein histidine kinase CheA
MSWRFFLDRRANTSPPRTAPAEPLLVKEHSSVHIPSCSSSLYSADDDDDDMAPSLLRSLSQSQSNTQASAATSLSAHHPPGTAPASERGSVVIPEALCHNPDIQEFDPDRPPVHEHGEDDVTETVADLGLTFLPRNPAALAADQISNADFDIAPTPAALGLVPSPEPASSAASITPSSADVRTTMTEADLTTPLTPVPLASVLSHDLEHALAQQKQQQQFEQEQYQREQYHQQQQQQQQQEQEQEQQQQQQQQQEELEEYQQKQQQQELEEYQQKQQQQQELEEYQKQQLAEYHQQQQQIAEYQQQQHQLAEYQQQQLEQYHQQQQQHEQYLAPPPTFLHHQIPAQPTVLFEMEINRLAERERTMSPEVKEFLADLSPDHQDFWLSQRRERLRLTAEERHKFIAHQALACNPLLTTNDINEFCMRQQLVIFEDLRSVGARVCSTAYFDWRLDKDIWDRFVGIITGEPSMWADDPPPLDRAPYLDAYKLTVPFSPPLSPTLSPMQFVHQQNPQLQPPSQPAPMPMVAEETNDEEELAQPPPPAPDEDPFLEPAHPQDPGRQVVVEETREEPLQEPVEALREESPIPQLPPRRHFKSEPGPDVMVTPIKQPSRAHSTAASSRSGFRSPRRSPSVLDTPTPPSRTSLLGGGGIEINSGLGHLEGSKGMPGLFKAVNYAPVVWTEH